MDMTGRSVAVVGVGSAIGAACAAALATAGAEVLAVDSAIAAAKAVADRIGATATPLAAPLFDPSGAATVADACRSRRGRLDALVYCASAMETWPANDDTDDRTRRVLIDNIMGPSTYIDALTPLLIASGRGSVVLLGSIDGSLGNPQVPGYSIGKAGVAALTRLTAQRLGPHGGRANYIAAAGLAQTGSDASPIDRHLGDRDLALRLTPLGRMPRPDEIASVALFLASDASSYVTGVVLPVDGGRSACTPGTW